MSDPSTTPGDAPPAGWPSYDEVVDAINAEREEGREYALPDEGDEPPASPAESR